MLCPNCRNWVEGTIKRGFMQKLTRNAVNKGGSMATGALIGSVVPGVGTAVGAGLGLVADTLLVDHKNFAADYLEESLFRNLTYSFTCPNCGNTWEENEEELLAIIEKGNEDVASEGDSNTEEEEDVFLGVLNDCLDKLPHITESEDVLDGFSQELYEYADESDNEVYRSQFFFLQSYCTLRYLIRYIELPCYITDEYFKTFETGYNNIQFALQSITEDQEYNMLSDLYELIQTDPGDADDYETMLSLYKAIHLNAINIENNYLKRDHWISILNLVMERKVCSVSDELFDNNQNDKGVEFMEEVRCLGDEGLRICANNALVNIYFNGDRFSSDGSLIKKDERKAYSYALDSIRIWGDKLDDYQPLDLTHLCWRSCLEVAGYAYICGISTKKDFEKGLTYMERAVELKSSLAAEDLAENYEKGEDGFPVDYEKSLKYYRITKEYYEIQEESEEDIASIDEAIERVEKKLQESSKKNLSPKGISSEEQEYVDALAEFFEDGTISEREKKMLERLRRTLGISPERAEELAQIFNNPQLTEEEIEYMESYQDYTQNGDVDEKARRKLTIIQKGLNLSDVRVKELEALVLNKE